MTARSILASRARQPSDELVSDLGAISESPADSTHTGPFRCVTVPRFLRLPGALRLDVPDSLSTPRRDARFPGAIAGPAQRTADLCGVADGHRWDSCAFRRDGPTVAGSSPRLRRPPESMRQSQSGRRCCTWRARGRVARCTAALRSGASWPSTDRDDARDADGSRTARKRSFGQNDFPRSRGIPRDYACRNPPTPGRSTSCMRRRCHARFRKSRH